MAKRKPRQSAKSGPKDLDPDRGRKIRAAREKLNLSQAELGDRFGVEQPTVGRWEAGYPPKRSYWRELAKLTGQSVSQFSRGMSGIDGNDNSYETITGDVRLFTYPIVGRVGAGNWKEVEPFEEPMGDFVGPVDDDYPHSAKRVAYLIEGKSMDMAGYPPGFYATAVDYHDAGVPLETGMVVVVEERRDGGHLCRRILKEIHVFRDHYELRSYSSDPAFKTITVPIEYFDQPKDEMRVIAIVTGVYRQVRRPSKT